MRNAFHRCPANYIGCGQHLCLHSQFFCDSTSQCATDELTCFESKSALAPFKVTSATLPLSFQCRLTSFWFSPLPSSCSPLPLSRRSWVCTCTSNSTAIRPSSSRPTTSHSTTAPSMVPSTAAILLPHFCKVKRPVQSESRHNSMITLDSNTITKISHKHKSNCRVRSVDTVSLLQ